MTQLASTVQDVKQLDLREYQKAGVQWLEASEQCILTDKPGLGKTLQAAIAASHNLPALVVAPTYLVKQWGDFLKVQFPDNTVAVADKAGSLNKSEVLYSNADFTVINVQMLRTHNIPVRYKSIVFDEMHHLRNRKSQQSQAAALLAHHNKSTKIFGLTATPMYRQVDDIWHLLHILNEDLFPDYDDFVDLFCNVDRDSYGNVNVYGIKRSQKADLDLLLSCFMMGRDYKDVGRALPPIINKNVKIELEDEQRELYDAISSGFLEHGDEYISVPSFMEIMHSWRRITGSSIEKIKAAIDAIDDSIDPTNIKPVVVFCWYKDTAKWLHGRLTKRFKDYRVGLITGDVPSADRLEIGQNSHIVIATISSCSEGVNFYHMRTVVFFEEHYPPGANYQALTRVVRDRNDDGVDQEPVVVYYIQVENTIDEDIHDVSQRREGNINDVMSLVRKKLVRD